MQCQYCSNSFPSRNALFQHLRTDPTCSAQAKIAIKPVKAVFLVGYVGKNSNLAAGDASSAASENGGNTWAAKHILHASGSVSKDTEILGENGDFTKFPSRFSMGSSSVARTCVCIQESSVHAVVDVVCCMVPKNPDAVLLEEMRKVLPPGLRLLACDVNVGDLHAERDCDFRRYEILLPFSVLTSEDYFPGEDKDIGSVKRTDPDAQLSDLNFYTRMKKVLKLFGGRHRWHNYSEDGLIPSSGCVYNKIHRFHHKGNVEVDGEHFVNLSVTGDNFMTLQLRKMIGLLIAVMRGWLPLEYVQNSLNEKKFLDVPLAPGHCLLLRASQFDCWESKHKRRANPRYVQGCDWSGFSTVDVAEQVGAWHRELLATVARDEIENGWLRNWLVDLEQECKVLVERAAVTTDVCDDCSEVSDIPRDEAFISSSLATLPSAPEQYIKVLGLLRDAYNSGKWPDSTTSRCKVIDKQSGGSSFSVGSMPEPLLEPRGNKLFPELALEAFILERTLMPDRPPSSTIAINRNVLFKPHRDSGTGAGQTISLIVGLGDYIGGDLVLEGIRHDIRYKPLVFNGWTQRHWVLPFHGERFSLVWFTPLGCENKPGIKVLASNQN